MFNWSKSPQNLIRYPWKVSEKNNFESLHYQKWQIWSEKVGNWQKYCTIIVLILCVSTENFDKIFSYSLSARFLLTHVKKSQQPHRQNGFNCLSKLITQYCNLTLQRFNSNNITTAFCGLTVDKFNPLA